MLSSPSRPFFILVTWSIFFIEYKDNLIPVPASYEAKLLPLPEPIIITHPSLFTRLSSIFSSHEEASIRVRPIFHRFAFLPVIFYRNIHQSFFPRVSEPFSIPGAPPVYALPWHSEESEATTENTVVVDRRAFQAIQYEMANLRTLLEAAHRDLDEERRTRVVLEDKVESIYVLFSTYL